MTASGLAVFVSSCDAYEDVWEPYFTLFFRYWPDCPFPIYLTANHLRYHDPRVETIVTGEDQGWATLTRRALEQLNCDYILYTHEDYFLDRPVNTERILRLLAYMKQRQAGYLRLYPSPGPDTVCPENPEVGEIHPGSHCRTGLMAAIWQREVFLSLLMEGETAWHMEERGSIRSNRLEVPFLSVVRDPLTGRIADPPLHYFCTAIRRRKWIRKALEFCAQEGVALDLARRPVETVWNEGWVWLSTHLPWLVAPPMALRRIYKEYKKSR